MAARAVIRVDGSTRLGMGHIMRCLAVADALRRRAGVESIFLSKRFEPAALGVIREQGYRLEPLMATPLSEGDVRQTQESLQRHAARLLITDLCHAEALEDRARLVRYHRRLRERAFTLLFTGGMSVDWPADIIVSPYFRRRYPAGIRSSSVRLTGPAYAVFRREFLAAGRRARRIARKARRVLITIGGSDELGLTTRILDALQRLPEPRPEVRVIIGVTYAPALRARVLQQLRDYDGVSSMLAHNINMASAMSWADLAVIGDGLTKYEAALTGTPSVTLTRRDREDRLSRQFRWSGTSVVIERAEAASPRRLSAVIGRVLNDPGRRARMSRRGRRLIDGRGVERIIETIPKEILHGR